MRTPIVIHTEEDYERAQHRVEELSAHAAEQPDAGSEAEIAAIAEAMLAFELRRDEAQQ